MTADAEPPTCSARGCKAPARWMLRWRNPRLHTADRVKQWAACDDHLEHLRGYLTARGFPCETAKLDD